MEIVGIGLLLGLDGVFAISALAVMTARRGRVPREGDEFGAAGLAFRVTRMDGRRIATVRVEQLSK